MPAELVLQVDPAVFMGPSTLPHYQAGERATHTIEHQGVFWSVTYVAEHDGVGWLVKGCEVKPLPGLQRQLREGDSGLVRVKVKQDLGAELQVMAEAGSVRQTFWIKREAMVAVD
jgi:hypothetical protein